MIVSNSFVRTYFFGSKVARIHNRSFQCCVSTAKEGLFQKQSTIILEVKTGNTVEAGAAGLRPCGKVIYSSTLRISDRFQFHDATAKTLDTLGEEGSTLEDALEQIFVDLKRRGIAVGTMNLAANQGQADFARDMEQGRKWLEEQRRTRELYRKSAEQGDAYAQRELGCLYTIGGGKDGPAPHDDAQAAFWWRKAAEQGDAKAQFNLGDLYHEGHGVPQDATQAAFWWRKAAEQDDAKAQHGLGFLYALGQGVPQDYEQAALWYRKAAERGEAQAQFQLGALYDDGLGVPQDYAEAYFWLDLVAAEKLGTSDSKQVAKCRDRAASHLTPADLSRQQERARKWFQEHQVKTR